MNIILYNNSSPMNKAVKDIKEVIKLNEDIKQIHKKIEAAWPKKRIDVRPMLKRRGIL